MDSRSSRRGRPNPFYVLLMLVSTAFVVTALAYYIGPEVVRRAQAEAKPGEAPRVPALVAWLDRKAPTALAIEFAGMVVLGLLAMAAEQWLWPREDQKARR